MSAALVGRIRKFLLTGQRPTSVNVALSTGEKKLVLIPESPRWATVAETICDLPAEGESLVSLEALGPGDETLRIERFATELAPVAASSDVPIPQVLSGDPETIRLTHFANLLARAHETGNNFMMQVTGLLLARSDRIEQRLERTEAAYRAEFTARIQEKLDGVEDDGLRSEMARMFFGGGRSPGAAAPAPVDDDPGPRPVNGWGGN